MALRKITFNDKTDLNTTSVPDANKVKASDLNEIKSVINDNVDNIYPVGSIYLSTNSTNPGTLFGGTWVQIKDKFLLSAGDTYTAGTTGGSATHYHKTAIGFDSSNLYGYLQGTVPKYGSEVLSNITMVQTALSSGTSNARLAYTDTASSLPPYIVVYVWERTA